MEWEQDEAPHNIPVYNIEVPIDGTFLTLHVRGDQHIGARGININEMKTVLKREQDQHRGHIFVLDTGDYIENALKHSVGHNYDIDIPDPADQLKQAKEVQEELDEHLYGKDYKNLKPCTRKNHSCCLRAAVIGNHEYRDRKSTGKWLNTDLFSGKGVLDAGIRCILNLTLLNKKLKMKKSYKIYLAHRFTNTSASASPRTLLCNFWKAKADIEADIYVCGHHHRRFVMPDIKFDSNGIKKRLLYLSNPSPAKVCEYAVWSMFSPIESNYYINAYLSISPTLQPWSKV